jgi:transposase, IS30 family
MIRVMLGVYRRFSTVANCDVLDIQYTEATTETDKRLTMHCRELAEPSEPPGRVPDWADFLKIWLLKARYTHISLAEREIIRRMLPRASFAEIARLLGKHRSTIIREIKRNTNAGGIYYEVHAHSSMLRRRKAAKASSLIIDNDLQLETNVEQLLKSSLSPEQVAGYMRRNGHLRPLCRQTIYDWVHRRWQSRRAYLRFKGRPRVPYGAGKQFWQPHKRHISQRPGVVERRRRSGDWEGDLVHGTRDDSRHALLTLVDRASGFGVIWKIRTLYPHAIAHIVEIALRGLPVRTITFDNGFEFGHHKRIEKLLKCEVYFTDVNSPEQRGSKENFNGLIREFFPKGTSLAHVTQEDATRVATILNRRPRKRLGYECPRNVFAAMGGLNPYLMR